MPYVLIYPTRIGVDNEYKRSFVRSDERTFERTEIGKIMREAI